MRPALVSTASLRTRLILGLSLLACACSGGNDSSKPDKDKIAESTGSGADDDDDVSGSAPVPMALLGDDILAQSRQALEESAASGRQVKLGENGTTTRDGSEDLAGGDASLVDSVIGAPGRAIGEAAALLDEVDAAYRYLFTSTGFFKNQTIEVPAQNGVGAKLFRTGQSGGLDFVEVAVAPDTAEHKYVVDLYRAVGDGSYERASRFEFSPSPSDASKPKGLRAYQIGKADPSGNRGHIAVDYLSAERRLTVTFGDVPFGSTDVPLATWIQLSTDAADATALSLAGAYIWRRNASAATIGTLLTRYAALQTGDIEIFQARAVRGGVRPIAQRLAFLPVEDRPTGGTAPADVFATHAYDRYAKEFLANLIRVKSIDAACGTAGDAFRQAFAGAQAPAVVASAPADLCKATPEPDAGDQIAFDLVQATCDAGIPVILPVTLQGDSAKTDFALCDKYNEAKRLANPQLLAWDGASKFVDGQATAAKELAALAELLQADTAGVPIATVEAPLWQVPAPHAAADFAHAADAP